MTASDHRNATQDMSVATGALGVVVICGESITSQRLPTQGELTIGREPPADILVDYRSVSRRRCWSSSSSN